MTWPCQFVELVFEVAASENHTLSWIELNQVLQKSTVTIEELVAIGLFSEYEERRRLLVGGQIRDLVAHPLTGELSYRDGDDIEETDRRERLFYHLDIYQLTTWFYTVLALPGHSAPKEYIPQILWYLGEAHIPGVGFVPLWYCRQLQEHDVQIRKICRERSRATKGLMLTADGGDFVLPGIQTILPPAHCFSFREPVVKIDWETLSSLYLGQAGADGVTDELLYGFSADRKCLVEKSTGREIRLSQKATPFFHYVLAELRKDPESGVDFGKARKHAGYSEETDTLDKMWTKTSNYRKLIKLADNRLFLVPYDSPDCSANT